MITKSQLHAKTGTLRKAYASGRLSKVYIKIIEDGIPGWQWVVDPTAETKELLLQLARSNESKPCQPTELGHRLSRYTNENSNCYDPVFDKDIRSLRPDWFINTADEKRSQFLQIAKTGGAKPKGALGRNLASYLNENSECYNAEFAKEIKTVRPDWFADVVSENKSDLLLMAERQEKRPPKGSHPLGKVLIHYTNPSSKSYDKDFDNKVRKLAPHWFTKSADESKKKLLKLAQDGKEKPFWKSRLGMLLRNYTCETSNSYDPVFDKQIRKLAPHWFVKTIDRKKQQLIEMAKRKETRPNYDNHPLGRALSRYTNKGYNTYDPVFDKKIRALAPHWFR